MKNIFVRVKINCKLILNEINSTKESILIFWYFKYFSHFFPSFIFRIRFFLNERKKQGKNKKKYTQNYLKKIIIEIKFI